MTDLRASIRLTARDEASRKIARAGKKIDHTFGRLGKSLTDFGFALGGVFAAGQVTRHIGALTSAAVISALLKQSETIRREYAQMPTTIGQAVTQVSNAFTRLVGELDSLYDVSAGIVSTLSLITDSLKLLIGGTIRIAATAAAGWGAWKLVVVAINSNLHIIAKQGRY